MRILTVTAATLLCTFPGWAKTISTPNSTVVIGGADIGKRVCYYEDKAYSYGAILQIGDHYIICKEANDYETNGELSWQELKKEKNNRKSK